LARQRPGLSPTITLEKAGFPLTRQTPLPSARPDPPTTSGSPVQPPPPMSLQDGATAACSSSRAVPQRGSGSPKVIRPSAANSGHQGLWEAGYISHTRKCRSHAHPGHSTDGESGFEPRSPKDDFVLSSKGKTQGEQNWAPPGPLRKQTCPQMVTALPKREPRGLWELRGVTGASWRRQWLAHQGPEDKWGW
jgi:hypothetical protein